MINIKRYMSVLFLFLITPFFITCNMLNLEELLFGDSLKYFVQQDSNIRNVTLKKNLNEKEWTVFIYMAAVNDLRGFAVRNIKQAAMMGSNKYLNIVIHLDIMLAGNKKITRRYYIKKGEIVHIETNQKSMDSGNPKTLISFCKWGVEHFPAKKYALFFWNHGTGILEPIRKKVIHPSELFFFNTHTRKLELDRSIDFIDFISDNDSANRGVCFDNSTGHYLTNNQLDQALKVICSSILHKKFDIIGFDTCLQSMIEIAHYIQRHANILISSQEVELGTGWNYFDTLNILSKPNIAAQTFAKHIVKMYAKSYQPITNDYTLSALNLNKMSPLEKEIDTIAQLLITALFQQKNRSVKHAIQKSRHKLHCTHFEQQSYIDLYDFLENLLKHVNEFSFTKKENEAPIKSALISAIQKAKKAILETTLLNVTGKNLARARGISIYFPEQQIHSSYLDAQFIAQTAWSQFLHVYLKK